MNDVGKDVDFQQQSLNYLLKSEHMLESCFVVVHGAVVQESRTIVHIQIAYCRNSVKTVTSNIFESYAITF